MNTHQRASRQPLADGANALFKVATKKTSDAPQVGGANFSHSSTRTCQSADIGIWSIPTFGIPPRSQHEVALPLFGCTGDLLNRSDGHQFKHGSEIPL
ncbi:hypothetical protein MRX96_009189 [Rhipicephalus microplus]